MIAIQELVKTFGVYPVLRGLDLDVAQGEFVAVLGPNGSGKSTLLRILSGLAKPTGGRVSIGGWTMPDEAFAVRRQLGVVSHLPLLYDDLTAAENLYFFGRLYNLAPDVLAQSVANILRQVGLHRRADDVVRTFSRGMLQRLAIARALLHDPPLLLLDEPYTGLDQDAARLLDDLLRDVAANPATGRTVIMTTHDLRRAHALATRVVILRRGQIGFDGPTASLAADDLPRLYADTIGAGATP